MNRRALRWSTLVVFALGLSALAAPPGARACQWAGWSLADLNRLAVVIVEADVVASDDGIPDLYVRRSFRGSEAGAVLPIVGSSGSRSSDCGGGLLLEVGEHVVIALSHRTTVTASETAIWRIAEDGSTIWGSDLVDFEASTLAEVIALLTALPDTATDAAANRATSQSPVAAVLGVMFGLGLLVGWRVFDRRPHLSARA